MKNINLVSFEAVHTGKILKNKNKRIDKENIKIIKKMNFISWLLFDVNYIE